MISPRRRAGASSATTVFTTGSVSPYDVAAMIRTSTNCQAAPTTAVSPPKIPVPSSDTWKPQRLPSRSMRRPPSTGAANVTKAKIPTRYSIVDRDTPSASDSDGTATPSMVWSIETRAQARKLTMTTKAT